MLNKGNAKAPETVKDDAAKVKAAAEAAAPQIDDAVLGSKSDKIQFMAPLGDPSRDDITTTEKDGKAVRTVTPTIVGYQFKVLEDMEVPECGTGDDLKNNPMSFKDPNGKRMAKAGEIINLTRFETGMLLSPPEFNARATGGDGIKVVCAYQVTGTRTKTGAVAKASESSKIPTVSLRALEGSVKDVAMVHVLDCETKTRENGTTQKIRHIKPGFEKWEPLCKSATRKPSTAAATPKTQRNSGAETFLKIVASKKA